jgi:cysteine desulfurase
MYIENMKPKSLPMPVYMDHNATTPVDPRVQQVMQPFMTEQFGNASSASHAYGWQAQTAVKKAREQVARLLGCASAQVVWTSGATESNNVALLGVTKAFRKDRPHLITQATEHKAVLEVLEAAREWDADVTILGVDSEGRVSPAEVEKAITPQTVLCSVMMANNEVGTLQPIDEIAAICQRHKVIFHSDAAQSVGKCDFDLSKIPIDLLSISGHKIYGPKGVGALVVRPINRAFELKPILFGGDQEHKLRPGTLNVMGIVGLGEACEIAADCRKAECERMCDFQSQIINTVLAQYPQVHLNGPRERRLCNNISFSLPDVHLDEVMLGLSGIAYSSGSACTSGSSKPSHVLKAMGHSDELARSTLRFGLGRFTTSEEVTLVLDKLLKTLGKVYGAGKASRRAH